MTKSSWQAAKEIIVDYAIKDLKENYGIDAHPIQITPKAYRDKPDHVLMFTEEIKSNLIYIMYRKDYKNLCDEHGCIVDKPIYFIVDKEKKNIGLYDKAVGGTDKSYVIPVEYLQKLTPLVMPEIETDSAEEEEVQLTLEFEDDRDENISTLTIRDLYSILQNKPVSTKKWLNELITNAKKFN